MHALQIVAGERAYERIRKESFQIDHLRGVLGASGGPKWFVLSHLDRYLASDVLPAANQSVHLIGSSIGAWRMACHAAPDPAAALKRLETEYLNQVFPPNATAADITAQCADMLYQVLGRDFRPDPRRALHIVTARCKGATQAESRPGQTAAFALVALTNLLARRRLRWYFDRQLFETHPGTLPVSGYDDFATTTSQLTPDNWHQALMASAAIPLALDAVRRIPGASEGCYRDGGMVDYHFDLPLESPEGILLYPHFTPDLKPGWFDKTLKWRKVSAQNYRDVLLLVPTRDFIEKLPHGKIPDRRDFSKLGDTDRMAYWRQSVQAGERLADEFHDWLAGGASLAQVQKLEYWLK